MTEEYDKATKLWITVLGVIVMLLIQWPTLLAPRLDAPPRDGSLTWNVVAACVGLASPLFWLIDDLRRYRLGIPWLVTALVVGAWVTVSFFLVHQ